MFLWNLLGPFREYIIYAIVALVAFGGFRLYVNSEANKIIAQKSAELLEVSLKENEQIRIELQGLSNRIQDIVQKDKEETQNVINNFNQEPDAFDDSGINGSFLR